MEPGSRQSPDEKKSREQLIQEVVELRSQLDQTSQRIVQLKSGKVPRNEEVHQQLMSVLPTAIYTCDTNGVITYFNEQAARIWGRSPVPGDTEERFCGAFRLYHIDGSPLPHSQTPMATVLRDGVSVRNQEVIIEQPDLTRVWVLVNIDPIRDETDRISGAINVFIDTTERKKVEEALRESEERFRIIVENLPGGVFAHDLDGNLLMVNAASIRNTGYGRQELLNMSVSNIDPSSVTRDDRAHLWQSLMVGKWKTIESTHIRKNGTAYPAEVHLNAVLLNGRPIILAIAFDITERKQSKAALEASEKHLHDIFENLQDVFYEVSIDGQILAVSPSVENLTKGQYRQQDIIGKSIFDLYADPGQRELLLALLRKQGAVNDYEIILKNRDDSLVPCSISSKLQFDGYGNPVRIIGTIRDISEHKKAEQALKESEEKYRLTFNSSPDAININRLEDGLFVDTNEDSMQLTGFTREDVIGRTSLEITLWHDPADRDELVRGLRERGFYENLEARFRRKDGSLTTALMSARVILLNDTPHIISITRDISDRKRAEAEREKLLSAIEQVGEVVFITDTEGAIEYVNPAFERITGFTKAEVIGKNPRILKSGRQDRRFYRNLWAAIGSGVPFQGRMVNKRKDGTLYTEEATISPVSDAAGKIVNYVAVKRDITDQLVLEDQFRQAQKMESVGRLAGGVAHDFNNKLGVILGNADMALEMVDPSQPIHDYLCEIQEAAMRSADLTRQLLAFARKQTISPQVLDLNETVEGMLKMLRRLIGEDIHLSWVPESTMCQVNMDPSQLDQILANLCVNARDAISGVGKVTIETKKTEIGQDYCDVHIGFLPGSYVMIAVSDDGCGMTPEIKEHLFEPFFTTKGVSKGTGLGLATVYGIVKQNSGFINVYSEPGKGTTFTIYLPQSTGKSIRIQEGVQAQVRGGKETLLLVEDEQALLTLSKKILEEKGYRVLNAGTPAEAMRLAIEYKGKIDLLITDVVMPEMNGRELSNQLMTVYPNIKTLFMSGYTANVIAHHGMLDQGIDFIQKPFSAKMVAAKVREILDR
jgi:two-component system, cell cycle sensor histidine kinase and response regulator CckA